jgi:hypothetical protein
MRALALLALLPLTAHAADMSDCHAYANRGSAAALRALLNFPFIDPAAGKFLYRKAYSYCLLQDDLPEMQFTPEEQPIIDMVPMLKPPTRPEPAPGSVPATDAADAPAEVPVAPRVKKARAASATVAWGSPQPTCIKVGMRTVYAGRHWRCQK